MVGSQLPKHSLVEIASGTQTAGVDFSFDLVSPTGIPLQKQSTIIYYYRFSVQVVD